MTMIGFAYVENGSPLLNNQGLLAHEAEQILGGGGRLPAASLLYGPMLQSLLHDRFQLQIHREVEDVPMYALTVAKIGFKLTPMQDGECRPLAPGRAQPDAAGRR
jgi:hypothetical protein